MNNVRLCGIGFAARFCPSKAYLLALAIFAGQFLAPAGAADVSRSVPDGARVALAFTNGTQFVLGDVIEMTVVLSNASAQVFQYETGGDYRGTGFPTRYDFSVLDEKGVKLREELWMGMGGLSGSQDLKPGEEHRQLLQLQNYLRVNRPGVFTVRVAHDFGWEATKDKPHPVAEAKITITLPTPEQAEKRVRAIASTTEPQKNNVLGAYWTRTEFRYLNHPVFLPGLERCAAEGNVLAMEGIQRIESKEATLALMRLLASDKTNILHAAVLFLSRRMPPRMVDGYPRTVGWFVTPEEVEAYTAQWLPEAAEPLRVVAGKLLRSGEIGFVNTGAFIIETIGKPEDGALVLEALGATLKDWQVRSKPEDNILNAPGAGDALINALAGLRERGYRAPRDGGINVIMARLLELADPKVPRSEGWEQLLEAFFTQNPPMLREAAVRALPKPPTGKWEKLLLGAMSDADRGVMRQACTVAGESKNPVFTEPLANIVRTERQEMVVGAATVALTQIGAHWEATDAWIERLADEHSYDTGLRFLAEKLEHPKGDGSYTSRTDLSREGRVAMRAKWQQFFANPERRALVQAGKPVPITDAQARELFSGVFSLSVAGGKNWPAEKE